MQPKEGDFDRFAPENVAAVAGWLASDLTPTASRARSSRCRAAWCSCSQGWRPLTEATADKPWTIDAVDAARGRAARATTTARIPPFFFSVAELSTREARPGTRRTRRSAPSCVAFLDAHAPPEAKRARDFTEGDGRRRHPRLGARSGRRRCSTTAGWCPATRPSSAAATPRRCRRCIYLEEMARARHPPLAALPGLRHRRRRACSSSATTSSRRWRRPRIRGDTVWCIGMSEPERRVRPRVAHDPGRARRRPRSSSTARRCGRRTRWWPRSASATCAPIPTVPKHKGISVLILDMDTPGIDVRPLRHITGAAEFAEVFFTDVEVPVGQPRRRGERRLAHHDGLARPRARRAVGRRASPACSGRSTTCARWRVRRGLDGDAGVRRRLAAGLRAGRQPARPRLQGLRRLRAGQLGARALLHEAGDVRAGQGALRARHGAAGPVRRGGRSRAGRGERAVGARRSSSASPSPSPAAPARSSATSSPPACSACRGRLMDFTLTDEQELLRDTARSLLDPRVPAVAGARDADDPRRRPLWPPPRASGSRWPTVRSSTLPVPRGVRRGARAGAVLRRRPRCSRRCTGGRARRPAPSRGPARSGDVDGGAERRTTCGRSCSRPTASTGSAFVLPGPSLLVVPQPVDARPVGLARHDVAASSRWPCPPEQAEPIAPDRARRASSSGRRSRSPPSWSAPLGRHARHRRSPTPKERVQFDVPIGSFQAVQHKLADMALAVERAWSAVYYAAMCHRRRRRRPPPGRRTSPRRRPARRPTRAAKDGIQIHGGIGYTWEHDLHLYIRRAYASEHLLGTTAWHHDRLAALLLD